VERNYRTGNYDKSAFPDSFGYESGEAAYAALEAEIYREPKMAFVGGVDGGDFYRKMIPLYKNNLQSGGFFAFEIGYDQGELLRSLGEAHGMQTEIVKDYSGLDRIAILKKQ
jgi:release factor glutamine methyltransferase